MIKFKEANINLNLPSVEESGFGIVPTSSTTAQLCNGDALAITSLNKKRSDS